MKKLKVLLLTCLISFTLLSAPTAQAAMPPKSKAFLVVCAYGTVGGALLGFATMAFGTNTRAIAQGASLGLYAGIIFGSYVLASHKTADEMAQEEYQQQYPPQDAPPPPGGGFGSPDGGGFGAPPPEEDSGGGFFDSPQRAFEIQQNYSFNFKNKRGAIAPPLYINFVNVAF
jgi:hypothetical protein